MEVESSNSPQPLSRKPSNFEELSMLQSLLFADSLKDLRNLRLQLYSAAEYFELSYASDDQKQFVVDTLKDYAMKAFINTVDHMGSITYKVNGILDASIEKVSGTELQVSCMEQRLRSYHKFIDSQGHSQQSLMLTSPKHHKRYMLPAGETLPASGRSVPKHQWCSLDDGDDWHHFRNAVRSSIRDTPSSAIRKGRSASPARPSLRRGATFSFTEKPSKPSTLEKRGPSPLRSMLPLIRTVSLSSRPTTPGSSRSTTPVSSRPTAPTSASPRSRVPPETRKSASMCVRSEKDNSSNEIEQLPTKSKRLLKALLSRRKSKKDDSLYTFLDEY